MKDLSSSSSRHVNNDNGFNLRASLEPSTVNPALGVTPMALGRSQALQRQQVFDIIQNVLAILDEDDDFDSFSSSNNEDDSRHSALPGFAQQ